MHGLKCFKRFNSYNLSVSINLKKQKVLLAKDRIRSKSDLPTAIAIQSRLSWTDLELNEIFLDLPLICNQIKSQKIYIPPLDSQLIKSFRSIFVT